MSLLNVEAQRNSPSIEQGGPVMPNLNVVVPYKLSQDEALQRIKSAIAQAQQSGKVNDLQENWNGNVGTFRGSAIGQSASGTITVNPSEIIFALTPPFAASLVQIPDRIKHLRIYS